MARMSKADRRQSRARAKLRESAIGAVAIGIVLLMLPLFIGNATLKPALSALWTPGWIAIAAGVALFALGRLLNKGAGTEDPRSPRAGSPRRQPERQEPTGIPTIDNVAPIIDDAVSFDFAATKRASAAASDDTPAVPTTWSAAVFDIIEWRRFEALCEWLFTQAGFETKTQSHGADGGIDIWLYSKNFAGGPVSVVQCKHWTTKSVGVAEVRALLGSMTHMKVKRGIFATTSAFTADATQFAKDNAIQLLDRKGLLELILKRTPAQQQELLAVATKDEFWVPTCASCGVKMTRRAPKKGGNGFWGCVNFPRCRTMING